MTNDLPDVEAALLAASVDTSNNASIPKENQTEFCLSCGAATPQAYCGECGLKNDDLRRSLFKLITETLGGIFSFEGRMWRTWAALIFKPGKVAREYSDGKRTTYSAPIRVYLVMTFLLISYLALSQTNLFAVAVSPKTPEQIAAQKLAAEQDEKLNVIPEASEKSIQEATQAIVDAADKNDQEAVDQAVEAVDQAVEDIGQNIKINELNFKFLFFQPQSKFEAVMDKSSAESFVDRAVDEDESSKATGLHGETLDFKKAITIFLTNPKRFNQQFNIWLPRAMFFMVPMVMFFGVIYIRGPSALLYDHLIHAIYIHSVFFMALLIAILLSKILDGGTVAKVLFIGLLVYLPLSLKRMFGRGWFKTIWTTLNIGFIYLLMLTIVMAGISAYSMSQLAI